MVKDRMKPRYNGWQWENWKNLKMKRYGVSYWLAKTWKRICFLLFESLDTGKFKYSLSNHQIIKRHFLHQPPSDRRAANFAYRIYLTDILVSYVNKDHPKPRLIVDPAQASSPGETFSSEETSTSG